MLRRSKLPGNNQYIAGPTYSRHYNPAILQSFHRIRFIERFTIRKLDTDTDARISNINRHYNKYNYKWSSCRQYLHFYSNQCGRIYFVAISKCCYKSTVIACCAGDWHYYPTHMFISHRISCFKWSAIIRHMDSHRYRKHWYCD